MPQGRNTRLPTPTSPIAASIFSNAAGPASGISGAGDIKTTAGLGKTNELYGQIGYPPNANHATLALWFAVSKNDLKMVENVLNQSDSLLDLDATDPNGWSLMHLAAYTASPRLIMFLLQVGISADAVSNRGHSPLHVAVVKGNADAVELLLEAGADPSRAAPGGSTPYYMWWIDSTSTDPAIPFKLIKAGADMTTLHGTSGASPITVAGFRQDRGLEDVVLAAMDAPGGMTHASTAITMHHHGYTSPAGQNPTQHASSSSSNATAATDNGATVHPASMAATLDYGRVLERLITAGAVTKGPGGSLTAPAYDGKTLIEYAVTSDSVNAIQVLLKHGVSANAPYTDAHRNASTSGVSAASAAGADATTSVLVPTTPLALAARLGHSAAARALLAAGADPDGSDRERIKLCDLNAVMDPDPSLVVTPLVIASARSDVTGPALLREMLTAHLRTHTHDLSTSTSTANADDAAAETVSEVASVRSVDGGARTVVDINITESKATVTPALPSYLVPGAPESVGAAYRFAAQLGLQNNVDALLAFASEESLIANARMLVAGAIVASADPQSSTAAAGAFGGGGGSGAAGTAVGNAAVTAAAATLGWAGDGSGIVRNREKSVSGKALANLFKSNNNNNNNNNNKSNDNNANDEATSATVMPSILALHKLVGWNPNLLRGFADRFGAYSIATDAGGGGSQAALKYLYLAGANMSLSDPRGTALHTAVRGRNTAVDLATLVGELGVPLNVVDVNGFTAAEAAEKEDNGPAKTFFNLFSNAGNSDAGSVRANPVLSRRTLKPYAERGYTEDEVDAALARAKRGMAPEKGTLPSRLTALAAYIAVVESAGKATVAPENVAWAPAEVKARARRAKAAADAAAEAARVKSNSIASMLLHQDGIDRATGAVTVEVKKGGGRSASLFDQMKTAASAAAQSVASTIGNKGTTASKTAHNQPSKGRKRASK